MAVSPDKMVFSRVNYCKFSTEVKRMYPLHAKNVGGNLANELFGITGFRQLGDF
jgi:hypothetical protein